jgi:hypothetical protein
MHTESQRRVAVNEQGRRIGEDHPNARYTDGEIAMVHTLHEAGHGYRSIARIVQMPRSTVRDICIGRRRNQTASAWRTVRVSDVQ